MKLRSFVAAACVGAAALAPVAATADSYTQVDAVGDVQQAPAKGTVAFTPASDRADGDIAYTKVSHRKHVVRVKIVFRDLTHAGPNAEFVRIKSNRLNREVDVFAYPGAWRGKAETSKFNGKKVRCNVRHSIDYVAHRVMINVPRSCLGNPRWVKVAAGAGTYTDTLVYADDARAKSLPNYYVWGPKVRR